MFLTDFAGGTCLYMFFPDRSDVWVFFSMPKKKKSAPLNKKEFPTGNEVSQTPWGRPNEKLIVHVVPIQFRGN